MDIEIDYGVWKYRDQAEDVLMQQIGTRDLINREIETMLALHGGEEAIPEVTAVQRVRYLEPKRQVMVLEVGRDPNRSTTYLEEYLAEKPSNLRSSQPGASKPFDHMTHLEGSMSRSPKPLASKPIELTYGQKRMGVAIAELEVVYEQAMCAMERYHIAHYG